MPLSAPKDGLPHVGRVLRHSCPAWTIGTDTEYRTLTPLAGRGCRRADAGGAGSGLCLEHFSYSTHENLRLDHSRGEPSVRNRDPCARLRVFHRGRLDAESRAAAGRSARHEASRSRISPTLIGALTTPRNGPMNSMRGDSVSDWMKLEVDSNVWLDSEIVGVFVAVAVEPFGGKAAGGGMKGHQVAQGRCR